MSFRVALKCLGFLASLWLGLASRNTAARQRSFFDDQDASELNKCMRDQAKRPEGRLLADSGITFPAALQIDSIKTIPQLKMSECEPNGCGLFNYTHPWDEHRQGCAREVPKLLHFIWLDHPLPAKYAANIAKVIRANPDYKTMLWVSPQAEDATELTKLLSTDEQRRLEKIKLAEHQDKFTNWDIISREPNVGARSDWLRLGVVQLYGGIYMDTDVGQAPEFSKYGGVFRWPFVSYSDPKGYGNLCNCIFGAEKDSELIKLASEGWREANLNHGSTAGPIGCGILTSAFRTYNSAEILMLHQKYMFMQEEGTTPVMSMSFDASWRKTGKEEKEQEQMRQKVLKELKQQGAKADV